MTISPSLDPQDRVALQRREMVQKYPRWWARIIAEWKSPPLDERAWLMYSANYLVHAGQTHWALDPLTLHWRVPEAPVVDAAHDLEELSFILLTHRHADHLDLDLLRALRTQSIRWVIPQHFLQIAMDCGLPHKNIIVPKALKTFEIEGVRITPFESLHLWRDVSSPAELRGVPETGYLAEFSGKRWLFPGDIRTFDASQLPSFGPVDGLFAHVSLGHGSAVNREPPMLEAFCTFCQSLQTKRIILTHLNEFGRKADDYWHEGHVRQVRDWFHHHDPARKVEVARLGNSVKL